MEKGIKYKPCRSTVYPPSGFVLEKHKELLDLPDESLVLDYVYGYSVRSCLGTSLFCTFDGRLVYPASAVIVIHSVRINRQDHFLNHEDEITALAMHPNGRIFASGETGFKPRVFVWDAGSLEGDMVKVIGSPMYMQERSVSVAALQFSNDGKYLVGIGNDNNHMARIWQWETGLMVFEGRSAQAPVRGISFLHEHHVSGTDSCNYAFVSVGNKHVRFWTMSRRQLSTKWNVDSNTSNFKYIIHCVCHTPFGVCVIGDSNGSILLYDQPRKDPLPGRSVEDLPPRGPRGLLIGKVDKAHAKGVTAISYNHVLNNGMFATGGGDGTVTIRTLRKRDEDGAVMHKSLISFNLSQFSTVKKDTVKCLVWGMESRANLEDAILLKSSGPPGKKKMKRMSTKKGGNKEASPFMKRAERPSGRSKQKEKPRKLVLVAGLKSSTILQVKFDTPAHNQWLTQRLKFTVTVLQYGHGHTVECAAANIDEHYFVSVSRDRTVRLWDSVNHVCLSRMSLPAPACSVDLHPKGLQLTVGLVNAGLVVLELCSASEVEQGKLDMCMKYKHYVGAGIKSSKQKKSEEPEHLPWEKAEEGPAAQKLLKSNEEIQCVAYSPDGEYLAAGSRDNYIYVFAVHENFKLLSQLRGHSSFVLSIDWSIDSKKLQSSDGAHELLYWKQQPGDTKHPFAHETHSVEMANVIWDQWTNIFGWSVQGIWNKNSDATDVNSVVRSTTGTLVLTGDDFRRVKLFRFPCVRGAVGREFSGHHSHIMCVRWIKRDDSVVLSCGGSDGCIFTWKVYSPYS